MDRKRAAPTSSDPVPKKSKMDASESSQDTPPVDVNEFIQDAKKRVRALAIRRGILPTTAGSTSAVTAVPQQLDWHRKRQAEALKRRQLALQRRLPVGSAGLAMDEDKDKGKSREDGDAASLLRRQSEDLIVPAAKTAFFDSNLAGGKYADTHLAGGFVAGRRVAPRQVFRFVNQGKFVAQANKIRLEAKMEEMRQRIAQRVQKTGLEGELDLVGDGAVVHDPVPELEWWDLNFLPNKMYDDIDQGLVMLEGVITDLVQHPPPIDPPFENSSGPTNVILTAKEKKKARRLRRLDEQKEKQEKIRLGLLPPEKPRVRISNMMRVLGQEAVLDPTKIEKLVQEEMDKRLEKHLRENEERKLTPEERKVKNIRKHTEDTSNVVHVAIFLVRDLSSRSHRFKIDINAQQHHLSGVGILHGTSNIIIVEGGPKSIFKYKNLMLSRIDWNDGESDVEHNGCVLLWEGMKKAADFRGFRFRQCPTEQKVRETLGASCETYWDLAKSQAKSFQ